ncbi:hypothetical protein MMC31_000345, partial [Peltigera leucophlebia]|nr:hypothetical protein [Peltigera leucophlebia]
GNDPGSIGADADGETRADDLGTRIDANAGPNNLGRAADNPSIAADHPSTATNNSNIATDNPGTAEDNPGTGKDTNVGADNQ